MSGEHQEVDDLQLFDQPDSELPPLPSEDDSSFLRNSPSDAEDGRLHSDGGSGLLDKEMKRQLMDIESSFLPDPSIAPEEGPAPGTDDTYLFGGSPGNTKALSPAVSPTHPVIEEEDEEASGNSSGLKSPATPADAYKTPAPGRLDLDNHDESELNTTSTSDPTIPSSPAAAAAQRTMSRTTSNPKSERSQETNDAEAPHSPKSAVNRTLSQDRSSQSRRPVSSASTVKGPEFPDTPAHNNDGDNSEVPGISVQSSEGDSSSLHLQERPSYLSNRHGSQRSSISSNTGKSEGSGDGPSDNNLGVDYALQSGGSISNLVHRPSMGLSRLPSLGSVASSASSFSDSTTWDRSRSFNGASGHFQGGKSLGRLDEEVGSPPATPHPPSTAGGAPTDTVIAQHVQNIQVPDTVAKEYREKHGRSPEKRSLAGSTFNSSRNKHNLTLKEQNSKIDKLSKENFDLKLKIHFLDQALQNRSDEGVKEMISKNVQLQTDLANEKKESQSLRRKVRELERKLKAHEEGAAAAKANSTSSEDDNSEGSRRYEEMEEEITYLRECLDHMNIQVEKLREEKFARDVEKTRLTEYIKSIGERRPSVATSAADEEAMEMWRELLEAETARREQADEDAQKAREEAQQLRDELTRLKSEAANAPSTTNIRNSYRLSTRSSTRYPSRAQSGSDVTSDPNESVTAGSSTLVDQLEQLRHENSELRRNLGAQTSMLTSRNRERERLQQEIEDLKLNARRSDGRSVAGDSIFDRSISRTGHHRSASRASGGTRATQVSDAERDEYENKLAALRDDLAATQLREQDLDRELTAHLELLDATEKRLMEVDDKLQAAEEEKNLVIEDMQALQAERDDLIASYQEKENECENLREEAINTIERLEDELEEKEREKARLESELDTRIEDFEALQHELKVVSESVVQLEDDRDVSQRKIQNLEQELEDANRELESLDKRLRETMTKNERLEVQLESSQNETSFLREEQEGDKVKIGELEAALDVAQQTVQEEKEKFHDLENRIAEERHQRDLIDSQEKQDVQKAFNDLNSQLSKAKEEIRKLRKSLSSMEVEATTFRQNLEQLENGLRETLGNDELSGLGLVREVNRLHRELGNTAQELGNTKHDLHEKDRILKGRDALLESAGLESRRLADLLDKERQARKQDRQHYEHAQRSHQNVNRTVQQHETRVIELEAARKEDRRKLANLEQQYREQLNDRNNLLYALWNRLSTLCGADWAQRNSLVNGELIGMEVIGKNLHGFSKSIILAVKTVEGIVGGFRSRIRSIERDLLKEYQTLEHTLDVRMKKMDHLERCIGNGSSRSTSREPSQLESSELARLKSEVKMLQLQLQNSRQSQTPPSYEADDKSQLHRTPSASTKDSARASVGATLLRNQNQSSSQTPPYQGGRDSLQPNEQKWIERLKELERRLKQEREARLLDRSGARKRLEEERAEREELQLQLTRARELRDLDVPPGTVL